MEATLYYRCRFNHSHKVALVQAGRMSGQQMLAVIQRVLACDPLQLRLARIDLAVSVPLPVRWFYTHAYCRHRRSTRIVGMGCDEGCCGGTIYFGTGQDLFRLYDKRAQLKSIGESDGTGDDESGGSLTRIERQLRSGKIPVALSTVGSFLKGIGDFNPFSTLVLCHGGRAHPRFRDYRLDQYLQGMGFRQLVIVHGLAETRMQLSARSRGNFSRKLRQLGDFLPADLEQFQIPDLFLLFQTSIRRQFGPAR
jgi:hypothetical protein